MPLIMSRGKSILLVDEDLPVRQALGRVLTLEDFCVVSAASGQEAVRKFGEQPIDVVVLDLKPHNETAWDTLRRLTALQPLLPVIIITARNGQQPLADAHTIDGWMEKPLDLPALIHLLNELASQTPEIRRRVISDRSANTQQAVLQV